MSKHTEKVADYVREHEGVSFVELEQLLEDHIEIEGDTAFVAPNDGNVIFWTGISQEFYDTVSDGLQTEAVHLHPCSKMVYLVDGKGVDYPLAKRPPSDGYVDEHWMPVAFYTYPYGEGEDD